MEISRQDFLYHAKIYWENGLEVWACHLGGKVAFKSWIDWGTGIPSNPRTRKEFIEYMIKNSSWGKGKNLGLLTGGPSGLLILDFDDRALFEKALEEHPAFAEIVQNTWIETTSKGVHVFLKTPKPVMNGKSLAWNVDIKASRKKDGGVGGLVVVAPSWKKSDQAYKAVKPWEEFSILELESLEALEFLGVQWWTPETVKGKAEAQVVEVSKAPVKVSSSYIYSQLSSEWKRVLSGEVPETLRKGKKQDRSFAESRLIFHLVNQGYTVEEIQNLFNDKTGEFSRFVQKGKKSIIKKTSEAVAWYMMNRKGIDLLIDKIGFKIGKEKFPKSQKAILNTVLLMMKKTGKKEVSLSIRDFEKLTGKGFATIGRNIKKLLLKKILISTQGKGKQANAYTFHQAFLDALEGPLEPPRFLVGEVVQGSQDAFSWGALGASGGSLVEVINKGEIVTPKELTEFGSLPTIKKKLEALVRLGFLEVVAVKGKTKNLKGYKMKNEIEKKDLDTIAQAFGTQGKKEKREKRIEEERRNFAQSFEALVKEKPLETLEPIESQKGYILGREDLQASDNEHLRAVKARTRKSLFIVMAQKSGRGGFFKAS